MIQLEGYKKENYRQWLKRTNKAYTIKLRRLINNNFIIIIIYIAINIILSNHRGILSSFWLLYILQWSFQIVSTKDSKGIRVKKPLSFTARAKRLYALNLILNLLTMTIFSLIYLEMIKDRVLYFPILIFIGTVIYYFQSEYIYISNAILKPMEDNINMNYFKNAQSKIQKMNNLRVVGITGSFGKTSTKFITGTILNKKFQVLNTPESYNTPMGLSKVINDDLNEKIEVFIAEMGARHLGDIKELSKLTKPNIGVITSIGPTHLETFKNLDNIMKTKYELIEELPANGIAIFNYDDEYIKKLADKTFKEKILYGIDNIESLDIYAEDIELHEAGSTFTIKDKEGHKIRCTTKLLGKHNIYNILAGVSVGTALGLDFNEIKIGIQKVEPIPHRLSITNSENGSIIIDDTHNSNPIGARAALEVLGQFKEGRKIIVTPGMVELGTREKEANREFGENIGKICDYVILIGKNTTLPIYEGLMKVGYSDERIFIAKDIDEATIQIEKIVKPKDVILFENHLSDNYNE